MPTLSPQDGSPLPLYRRVQKYVLERIGSGEWRPGELVPSESRLVEALGVSRMTVNRAVRELAGQGVLTRLQGVGTFVARPAPERAVLEIRDPAAEIAERGGTYHAEVILLREEPAPARVAVGLGLEPGGPVFRSLVLHCDGDTPVQLEDRFVNPAMAPHYLDQDFTAQTPGSYLIQTVPLSAVEVEHVIEAVRPDRETRRLLRLPEGEPCLVLNRRTWTGKAAVTLVRLFNPGSTYRLKGSFKP